MEPTAVYFACRKACEPIHIQWNVATNMVKAVNCTSVELKGLTAEAVIYNLDSSVFQTKSAKLDCPANSVHDCLTLFGEDNLDSLSNMHFIKLSLKSGSGEVLSTNFYWRNKTEWKYEELANMKQGQVSAKVGEVKDGHFTVDLENTTSGIVLMARLKLVDVGTGELVAPVFYSDNYFSLAPHEARRINISLKAVHPRRAAKLFVEGWNVAPLELAAV
jgi:hypothetical protein